MTLTIPESITHLDHTPACESTKHEAAATHIAYWEPPCGCQRIRLTCQPCAAYLKRWARLVSDGQYELWCTACDSEIGVTASECMRIEAL